jgi:exopolyphosphatase/guanosine-5'-triphosphate,3'-diphosphate pyrophosphatase
VVGLTEGGVKNDPPLPEELMAMDGFIRGRLSAADWSLLTPEATLVGTAGTVTTMTAMLLKMTEYDRDLINNRVVDLESAMTLLSGLAGETVAERAARPGLHPRRADVIVAGLVLVTTIMDFFSKAKIIISDDSLLEGLWLAAAGLIPLNPTDREVSR